MNKENINKKNLYELGRDFFISSSCLNDKAKNGTKYTNEQAKILPNCIIMQYKITTDILQKLFKWKVVLHCLINMKTSIIIKQIGTIIPKSNHRHISTLCGFKSYIVPAPEPKTNVLKLDVR